MSQSLSQFRLQRKFQTRLYIFSGFILSASVVLLLQLGNLQLVHGFENRVRAKKFVSRQEFTRAPRGLIYDRNYRQDGSDALLVKNINYIDFIIHPSRFKNRKRGAEFVKEFCSVMGLDIKNFEDRLTKSSWKKLVRKNKPITLIHRITRREQERLAEFNILSRHGQFLTRHLRYYTMGSALAHVTGYIGKPNSKELAAKKVKSYQMIGKGGVESVYDLDLRGSDGVRTLHRILRSEEQVAVSEHGNNLILTIDRKMQAAAYKALVKTGKRGAVVALKTSTGEVLALVSNPSFDPNVLSSGTRAQRSKHIVQIKDHKAFLNMAMQAKFPPASTFKPLVALTSLETRPQNGFIVTENTSYRCPGAWILKSTLKRVPDTKFYCWEHAGHGTNNMIGALAHSCNVYFYQLGYKIGPTPMMNYARSFGFDKPTGIDLPGEIPGRVPSKQWKQITYSGRWYDGDTVNLAIGQGFLEVTPLENAVMYAALVNNGRVYQPYLLKAIRHPTTNKLIRERTPKLVRRVKVSPQNIEIVKRGMRSVMTEGTARFLSHPNQVPVAGKTGTVQTRSRIHGGRSAHAWYVGYAPFGGREDETVVVAVFVEYGQGGSAAAAPIAVETLRAAFPDWAERQKLLEQKEERAAALNDKENNDEENRRERPDELNGPTR